MNPVMEGSARATPKEGTGASISNVQKAMYDDCMDVAERMATWVRQLIEDGEACGCAMSKEKALITEWRRARQRLQRYADRVARQNRAG